MADTVQHYSFEACCGHVRHLTVVDHSEAACQKVLDEERHVPCAKCLEAEQSYIPNHGPDNKPTKVAVPPMDSVKAK